MSSSIRLLFPGIVLAIASIAVPMLSAQAENPRVQAGEAIVKVFKKEGEETTDVRRAAPYRAQRYDAPTPTTPPAAVLDDANALLQRKQGAFFSGTSSESLNSSFGKTSDPLPPKQAETALSFKPVANAHPPTLQRIEGGAVRVQSFSPARNDGYGKMYEKDISPSGDTVDFRKYNEEF